MTQDLVGQLYDSLFQWENKRKAKSYPIHKKLNVNEFGFTNVYNWIVSEYPEFKNQHILDAGCGVGYGSLYLAEHLKAKVTGISVSNSEIIRAKKNAYASKTKLVAFECKSYDDLPKNTYDVIIAVESIKHTLHLNKTLQSCISALKQGGKLVVIDDFLTNKRNKKIVTEYANDWFLREVFSLQDFISFNSNFKIKKDLTPFVATKPKLILQLEYCLLRY